MSLSIRVHAAEEKDLDALAPMAMSLIRLHHEFDPQRFFSIESNGAGYVKWLGSLTKRADAAVFVALAGDEVVGYACGTLEGRDWMQLRDACGVLQDIYVVEHARRSGAARMLVEQLSARFRELGAPRLVLSTAAKNEGAQKFFEVMGFRRTMIEMTRELVV